MRLRWVEGDPSSLDALRAAELAAADSLVIGDSGEGPAKEADARTLTTIALAQVALPSIAHSCTLRDQVYMFVFSKLIPASQKMHSGMFAWS